MEEEIGEVLEEEFVPKEHDLMELFEELSFKEKWQKVSKGLKAPKDSGDYKWAQLQMLRLLAPVSAVIVPIIFMFLLAVFTALKPPPAPKVEVKVIEPEELEELEEIEEIIEEPLEPPEVVEVTDFSDSISDFNDPSPVKPDTDFSPKPADFDSVAIVRSPVMMKGILGGDGGHTGTSFMGGSGMGSHFAFVIDYSKSMKPDQLKMSKHELFNAIKKIGEKGCVSVLFFSGPVWRPDQNGDAAKKRWTGDNNKGWFLAQGAESPNPQYLLPNTSNLAALERMIYKTPTTFGTDWYHPLKLVLDMKPRPNMIFFMTDGACSKTTSSKCVEYVKNLPDIHKIKINTVVLGIDESKAEPLKEISELTKGSFRHFTSAELSAAAAKLPPEPVNFQEGSLEYMSAIEAVSRMRKGGEKGDSKVALETDIEIEVEIN